MSQLHDLTAVEIASAVRSGETGPREVVEHFLARIDRFDSAVGAFVYIDVDGARTQAAAQERILATEGTAGLPALFGVPTAIKDLNQTAGIPTGMGSAAYRGTVPTFDDNVVTRLRQAGTISLGKTSTPEFGLPCYTETDVGLPARTPWDLSCSAGGSSGGAAAAVAAGLLPIAQGSDGGGSIRIPASVCGLVGLKPSRGRISNGPMGDPAGLGVVGPLARTVRDAAAFLDATAGPMSGDPSWAPALADGDSFAKWCEREPGRLRIGRYLDAAIPASIDPECIAAWENASALLESLGHEVVDIPCPVPQSAIAFFEIVWSVGAASIPVDPAREHELRPLTTWLRERGRAVSGPQHAAALGALTRISRTALSATSGYDALLTPTLGQLPRPIGWFTDGRTPAEDFQAQKEFTPYTSAYNLTGLPAISLPLHWVRSQDGDPLPVGVMLAGRPGGDGPLLALAASIEAADAAAGRAWHACHPQLWGQ
jgi:amidase